MDRCSQLYNKILQPRGEIMTKPKMSNSSFIALSCELAHNRVLEDDLNNEYCSIKIKSYYIA